MNAIANIKNILNASFRHQQGAVLPLVGLALGVIIMASGFAVDYSRAQIVRERLQWAVDAAALAGAKIAPSSNLATVQKEANAYFRANFPNGYMGTRGGAVKVSTIGTVNGKGEGFRFSVSDMTMENYFADIVGLDDIKVSASADVNTLPISPLDLVFSLDLSGSMLVAAGRGCTFLPYGENCYPGVSKLDDAKSAMRSLVETLHNGNNVRFGLVGWSSIVNVAGSIGGKYKTRNCEGITLSAVASTNPLAIEEGNAAVPPRDTICREFTNGTIRGARPQERMQYLTSDKGTIRAAINRQTAEANTDGALGMFYSYQMFKKFKWVNYVDRKAKNKAIVLLTDGVNTKYYGSPGGADASQFQGPSNAKQLEYCTKAKNEGIVIYTIAYDMDDNDPNRRVAKNMLRSCASSVCPNNSGSVCFFDARQSAQLNKAMEDIGNNMMTMRLTR